MNLAAIDFQSYIDLRDHDITHRDIDGGPWKLGHTASWARWGKPASGKKPHTLCEPITANDEESFFRLKPMTTAVVLLGLNWGGKELPTNPGYWENFHNPKNGGDTRMRNAFGSLYSDILGDEFPAVYITDVFKLIATGEGSKLNVKIKEDYRDNCDHVGRCAELLVWELQRCKEAADGRTPVIVAMGDQSEA